MSQRSTFFNSPLSASDALEQCHPSLQALVGFHVYQVRAWQPMLRDENWLAIPTELIQEFRGLSLESGDELGAHKVILEYHNSGPNNPVVAHTRINGPPVATERLEASRHAGTSAPCMSPVRRSRRCGRSGGKFPSADGVTGRAARISVRWTCTPCTRSAHRRRRRGPAASADSGAHPSGPRAPRPRKGRC